MVDLELFTADGDPSRVGRPTLPLRSRQTGGLVMRTRGADGRRVARRERLLGALVGAVAVAIAVVVADVSLQRLAKAVLGGLQRLPVLRALRPGQRRLDRRQVELQPL